MRQFQTHFRILGTLVAVMWVIQALNLFVFRNALVGFGIVPRSVLGLRGVLFAPFLHGGWVI